MAEPVTTDLLTGPRSAPLVFDRSHPHPQSDVVGYRIRRTIVAGKVLVAKNAEPVLIAVFGPHQYLDALECARRHRTARYHSAISGGRDRILSESEGDRRTIRDSHFHYVTSVDYACVDPVYRCGCAWGDFDYMPNEPGVIGPCPTVTSYTPEAS